MIYSTRKPTPRRGQLSPAVVFFRNQGHVPFKVTQLASMRAISYQQLFDEWNEMMISQKTERCFIRCRGRLSRPYELVGSVISWARSKKPKIWILQNLLSSSQARNKVISSSAWLKQIFLLVPSLFPWWLVSLIFYSQVNLLFVIKWLR